jgi:DNA-binding CsgD family transcriptional regulator
MNLDLKSLDDDRWIETNGRHRSVAPTAVEGAGTAEDAFRTAICGALDEIARQIAMLNALVRSEAQGADVTSRTLSGRVVLTRRQLEILRFVAHGRSTDWIATELWLSVATVRNHVARAMRVLDAHSRLEAVAKARDLGLI